MLLLHTDSPAHLLTLTMLSGLLHGTLWHTGGGMEAQLSGTTADCCTSTFGGLHLHQKAQRKSSLQAPVGVESQREFANTYCTLKTVLNAERFLCHREEAARLALQCKNRYQSAIEGLRRLLVRRSKGLHKLWYIGELLQGQQFVPAFSSTSCGLSGTLALGHIHGMDDENESHLKLSKRLAESCVRISQLTASGLPPDVSWLNGRPKAHEDAVSSTNYSIHLGPFEVLTVAINVSVVQVEWFVPDEDSQRLQQLHAELVVGSTTEENRASSKSAHESTRLRLESAEIVVMRDERGSSACTGGHALAQSLYWLYRATVRVILSTKLAIV